MKFEDLIEKLIMTNDCVIIPDFGGFISNYESAQIESQKKLIHPPFKQVLFNPRLTKNDGLLSTAWTNYNNSLYQESLMQIKQEVISWKKQLEQGERIEIGEIGFLFLHNKLVVFEQNREFNLLLSAYGLTAVKYELANVAHEQEIIVASNDQLHEPIISKKTIYSDKELIRVEQNKEAVVIRLDDKREVGKIVSKKKGVEARRVEQPKGPRNYKRVVRWVAAAAIVPVAFYSYWIPMKTDFLNTGKIHYSDFNPFRNVSGKLYEKRNSDFNITLEEENKSFDDLISTLPADVAIYNLALSEDLIIPVKLDRPNIEKAFNKEASLQVIVGCFSVESNAQSLVQKLNQEGFVSGIVDKNKGLYRVSAGATVNDDDANALKERLKDKGYSAWILKK